MVVVERWGWGDSMDKGLEAGLNEPSHFLTETLSSMSSLPRPLHQPPDNLCSSQPVLFINYQESPGLLALNGSWQAQGQSQVNVGWQNWGWQEGMGQKENTSPEQAADWAAFSAWALSLIPFFLPSIPRLGHTLLS